MKKIFKWFFRILGIGFIILAISLTVLWFRGVKEREYASQIIVNNVVYNTLTDGVYYGYYDGGLYGYRENAVEVTIENGLITDIKNVINKENKSEEFLEDLYSRVITNQTLDVDTIVSATLTSNAYLKAIEDALSGTNPVN